VHRQLSYWQAALPPVEPSEREPLPRHVDVAVIGGGFAGLSITLDLLDAAPGAEIALIEAHRPGFGASGRNAGGVLPFAVLQWLLPGRAGPLSRAGALATLHTMVRERTRRLAADHPDAEVVPTTMMLVAAHPPAATGLRWAGGRLRSAGLDATWWERDRVAATGALPRPALTFPAWTVQPAALAASLARRARRAGATLLEDRPVAAVVPDPTGVTVVLRDGSQMRADRVVVATGAYSATIELPEPPGGRIMHAQMQAGPPCAASGPADLFGAAIGLDSTYWRWHGGRLLVGGADGHRAVDPRAQRIVARRRDRYVPGAAGTVAEHRWSGPILVRRGELPLLAHSPSSSRIIYAFGFAGSGIALATSAGPLVRDLVLGPGAADPAGALLRVAIAATGSGSRTA